MDLRRRGRGRGAPGEGSQAGAGADGFPNSTFVGNDDPTQLLPAEGNQPDVDERTMLHSSSDGEVDPVVARDPVTGWLVIVKGPGRGRAVPLGNGMNVVGRGTGQRVPLPFGDRLISSEDHIRILYDDAERAFHISHGSSQNLSRVDGKLLSNLVSLPADAVVQLSKETTAVFKPFCGPGFDWADEEGGPEAPEG